MLSGKFLLPKLSTSKLLELNLISKINNLPLLINKYSFSQTKQQNEKNKKQLITYTPIRPLKKNLTSLYVQKQYLNKDLVKSGVPYWPYFTPFYAMLINNYFTQWSLLNSSITFGVFLVGIYLRQAPLSRRQHEIIKLQCNHQLTKFYITVLFSLRSVYISNKYPKNYEGFQEWNVFTQQQLKKKQYVPSQTQKKTLSQSQLKQKRKQFDQKLFQKIMKQSKIERTIKRFELDSKKTVFKLSNRYDDKITESELVFPTIPFKMEEFSKFPYKYLIVRTEFLNSKNIKPYHFCIDLEQNGDLRYQDYLIALGAHYRISNQDSAN